MDDWEEHFRRVNPEYFALRDALDSHEFPPETHLVRVDMDEVDMHGDVGRCVGLWLHYRSGLTTRVDVQPIDALSEWAAKDGTIIFLHGLMILEEINPESPVRGVEAYAMRTPFRGHPAPDSQ